MDLSPLVVGGGGGGGISPISPISQQGSEHREPLKVLLGRYSFMPPPNRRVVVRHNLAWTVFHCIKLLWYHQLKILKNNLHLYSMLK